MEKRDYKKEFKEVYKNSAKKITIVTVPTFQYLIIDGVGDPNTAPEFQEAIEALYALSYTIKFKIKKGSLQTDYGVMPLEGQWWTDNMEDFSMDHKDQWKWSLMIMQPSLVTKELVKEAMVEVAKKKKLPALPKIRFSEQEDGLCIQIMHIGPYSEEAPTVEKLLGFMKENELTFNGKHREIYLSDARRTAPERLKTILRIPVKKNN